jgi:lipoprotein-releasing system permease protein
MTRMLIFRISWALMTARWRQTLVAAIGVTFSITMFIALLGFMQGLNRLLDGLIMNRTAHIRLYNEIGPNPQQPVDLASAYTGHYHFIRSIRPKDSPQRLHDSGTILKALRADGRVLGVAPKVTAQVFFNVGTTDISGVINGIDVEAEARLFVFNDYVAAGRSINLVNTPNSIILGIGAAEKMMARVGDMVQVTTSRGDRMQLKVVGYFQSGIQEVDAVQSYASLVTAQKLLGENTSYVTDIQVKLKDVRQSYAVAQEFAHIYRVDAIDFNTANAQFETGSSVRTLISYAVGITLLVVAGFGIYNILNMMIYDKMDSIAILKATGFSGSDVNAIFIFIALSIGVFGGLLGLILGLGTSVAIDQIPFNTPALPTVKTYPIDYDPWFYLIATLFSLITTYLAGYLPARKASAVDPVDIIRGK